MRIYRILILLLLLFNTLYATVYEDAENGDIEGWSIYNRVSSIAQISNIVDSTGRVIKLTGKKLEDGFMLGNYEGRQGAWNNTTAKTISWRMKYSSIYQIYIRVVTSDGPLYVTYQPKDSSRGDNGRGYIFVGVGADTVDGNWHTITRDLEADIQTFRPNTTLKSVHAFMIRGGGLVDDIMMDDSDGGGGSTPTPDTTAPVITLSGANPMSITQGGAYTELGATATDNVDGTVTVTPSGTVDTNTVGTYTITYSATDSAGNTAQVTRTVNVVAGSTPTPSEGTVYEDAEDGNTEGWIIYDHSSSQAKVSNVVDSTGRVIELTGRKLDDGFMLGNIEGRSGSWNNTTDKRLSWRMKYSSLYYIYIRVVTSEGPMYIIYRPTDSSPGYVDRGSSGVFIYIGLGTATIDGNWHTITRDLEADIQAYRPGVTLKSIHAFLIRGGGRLDDIMTGSPDDGGGSTPTPDTTAPVIIVTGDNPMTVTQGGTYTEPGATATDNVDGAVNVTTTGSVDTGTIGAYTITYSATDSAGNSAEATRTVNVVANTTPPPTEDGTVYEDAENGDIEGWSIYDRVSSIAQISNIVDSTGRVIKLTGKKLEDGFMLGNYEGRQGAWNNTTAKTISWRMKYSSIYQIYIRVVTSDGPLYVTYQPKDSSRGDNGRGYIFVGVGADTVDGNWHTITRDLEADIQTFRPNTTLKSVHAFMIRGGGLVDDIMMGEADSTPTPDTTAPVITLNGDNPMTVTQGGTYTEPDATANDNVDGVVNVTTTGNVDTSTVGIYTITYSATDSAGNSAEATRTVNVVAAADTTAPVITLNGDNPMTVTQGGTYTEPGATANDNVDGVVNVTTTGSVDTNTVGIYTITYSATDSAGNSAEATRTVNVVAAADTAAPVITLNGDNPMTVTQGGTYTEPGATANDNVDGVVNVTTTGSVDTNTVGIYTITYSATDSAGNSAEVTRTVNVMAQADTTAPVITLNGDNPMTVTQGGTYTEPGATANDNVDGVVNVTTTGNVDTNTIGAYTITYSATDSAGNSAEATRTVNVVAANASLTGRVTSTTAVELQGVTVNIYNTGNPTVIASSLTGSDGSFGLLLGADQDLTLQFIAEGYATQVLPIHTPASGQQVNFDIVMIARGAVQNVPASGSATLTGADGASVTVTGGSFVDGDGNPVSDNIQLTITPVDVSTPLGSQLFPGNFIGIQEGETTPSPIASYGVVEYRFTRNGEVVNLAVGATAEIEIPIYVTTHPDGTPIQVGDTIPLWYLDETTGMWQQEGTGTVVVSLQSPTGFAMRATVSHFSWWNCDIPYGTAQAIVTVHAPFTGTATVYAKTEAYLGWWRPKSVHTVVSTNVPTQRLYIPSDREVCFWADTNLNGTILATPQTCLTAGYHELVNVDLSLLDTDLDLSVTPDATITTEVNKPAVPTTILPTTYESSVTYNITAGHLPAGVSLKTLDNTRVRIEGVPTEMGTFPITVQGVDSEGNSDTIDITYNSVVDNTPPEITLLGDNPIEVNLNTPFNDPGATASDNRDGDITHKVGKRYYDPNELEVTAIDTSVAGSHMITYDVADAAGNQASQVTRTVEVITCQDNPMIMLNGESVIDLYQGDTYNEAGATAYDCRERPIEDITIDGSVDVNVVDTYTLTYTATDPFGNQASVTRTVNVLERPDAVPDTFSFTDVMGVEPNTLVQAGVTITGINMESPVSIQGGEYSVDNGDTWRTTDSNVVNNTSIFVRHWSSWDYETDVSTTLTVGGVSDTFTSTTRGFVDQPPVARLNYSEENLDVEHYYGAYTPYVQVSGSDESGIAYCQWTDENDVVIVSDNFSGYEEDKKPKNFDYGHCEVTPDMFDTVGTYRYTFMVRDTSGQTDTIDMNVEVFPNNVPVVDIGGDRSVVVGEVLNITATATDDDTDELSYSWMYGPKDGYAMYGAGNTLEFSHQFEVEGVYIVQFTATDVHGAVTTASIEVTVTAAPPIPNQSPTAYAGMDQMVASGTDVILDGGDSYDNDGYILSYLWEEGSTQLSTDAQFSKNDFSVGTHTVTLTVTDDDGDTDSDEVTITIVDSQVSPVFEYQYMYQGRFEDVAVDAQGNSYAAGWRFDGCAENGQVTPQAIIVKYDSDGQMIDNWESDCTASRKLYGITLHGNDLYAVGYQQSGDPHYYENGGMGDPTQIDGYAVKFDLSSYLDTQSGNPATFANANFHQIFKSVAIYDNHLYAVGFAVDNTSQLYYNDEDQGFFYGSTQSFISRLDLNLNEQQTAFGVDGSSFSDLAIDDTGAIWATDDTTGELTLLRYDNFLVLDQVYFDVGDGDQLYGVTLDPNDNVIVCGTTYNPNNDNMNALAIKYDPKAGESVWENIYESSNDQKFLDIQYDLLSDSFYTVGNVESDATMRDGFFMKIDPDGYKVWEHAVTVDQDQSLNALGIQGYNLYGVGYNFNNDDHISLPWIDSITEQSQSGVVVVTPGT